MIKLEEVIDALDFINSGIDSNVYYNTTTNEFTYISSYDNTEIDEDNENYIMLPSKYYINEYSMMEEFIDTIDNIDIYNELVNSIRGRRAFRRFKDTCFNFDITELAIEWGKHNNIKYVEENM